MKVEDSLATGVASEADAELAKVLESYLAAMEAGHPPDPEKVLGEHPAIADRLRSCLASLHLVEREGGLFKGTEIGDWDEPSQANNGKNCLGDFRILREVGRGGMGVVYEAEQISLGRRVALKVLPFAATMDSRQLLRFQNESRSAASLEHPHIVPVYGVGCERGVHYYAMKFIDGQTAAQVIADLRLQIADLKKDSRSETAAPTATPAPGSQSAICNLKSAMAATSAVAALPTHRAPRDAAYFRRAAEWGIQAAEALEHAHSLGIVHRDIKPANLMIDAQGKLWVTDFGLARSASPGGDAGGALTMTGELLGTLRYMSPEQALAKHGLVDNRTDVYSLGVTLYELLTLEPAFAGQDRQELMRQIALEEPRSLRRLNRAAPVELETILLKAMEKEISGRYITAQELADDLRRLLEDKPIQARRPSLVERARKWGRRHKPVVRAAFVTLLLAVILLAVSTVAIWDARQDTEHALGERTQALEQAQERELEARRNLAEASRQQDRANNNFRQAIEEISQLVKAGEVDLSSGRSPQLEEVRKAQFERSLAFYQRVLQENRSDPAGRLQTGLVYRELLTLYVRRKDAAKALQAYGQAVAVFKELTAEFPAESRYQGELAGIHLQLQTYIGANVGEYQIPELKAGRYQRAAELCQQAVTMSQALMGEQPDEPVTWHLLAVAFSQLGVLQSASGQAKEAEESFSSALPIFEKAAGHPRFAAWVAWMGEEQTYAGRGKVRAQAGRFTEAEGDYRQALAVHNKMPTTQRLFPVIDSDLASAQDELGNVLWAMNRRDDAAEAFRRAEEGRRQIQRSPKKKQVVPLNEMARFYATCPDEQFRNPAKAVELAHQAIDKRALWYSPRDEGDCWKTLGVAQYRAGDWKAAVAALEKAMPLRNGGDSTEWFFLAMAQWQLDHKDDARAWYDKALHWMRDNKPKDPELLRFRAEAADLLRVDDQRKQEPE
jgi:serine/threonine protein kinase/Flp pilus assembly protein TadD